MPLINIGVMAVFGFIKCQRWDYIMFENIRLYGACGKEASRLEFPGFQQQKAL
jgi:hypothetical protein